MSVVVNLLDLAGEFFDSRLSIFFLSEYTHLIFWADFSYTARCDFSFGCFEDAFICVYMGWMWSASYNRPFSFCFESVTDRSALNPKGYCDCELLNRWWIWCWWWNSDSRVLDGMVDHKLIHRFLLSLDLVVPGLSLGCLYVASTCFLVELQL